MNKCLRTPFLFSSDTSNSEALSVAAFSCVGTPDSDSQSHPQEGHLQWMFASGSLLLLINTATSTSLNNRKVCVQFEEGSSSVVPLLVDSHRMRSRGQVVCKQVGTTGRVSFLLESNFKPFDARHIFLKYSIQHN